jgi:hypothetical protein
MTFRDALTILCEALSVVTAIALWPARLTGKLFRRSPYSVWTGTPIITIAINARAERLLGYRTHSIVSESYYLTEAFDYNLSQLSQLPVLRRLVPSAIFLWVCVMADRVHLFCDRGLLPTTRKFLFSAAELLVYRLFGIEVFLWTYGADVRTRSTTMALGTPNCCVDCDQIGAACICDDLLQRERYRKLARMVTAVFSMGDMKRYTPGSINDAFFWPLDLDADSGGRYAPRFPDGNPDRPLRIVHAANHRVFKGTKYLQAAVSELQAEGEAVELVLVERIPNREALEIYRTADVIFDQCLIGFHGYFALEAMALGKPVMCFIRDRADLLAPDECPIIDIHLTTLKEDIRRLVRERSTLPERGVAARRYVERHFSIPAFAERLRISYGRLGIVLPAL